MNFEFFVQGRTLRKFVEKNWQKWQELSKTVDKTIGGWRKMPILTKPRKNPRKIYFKTESVKKDF
jgi:hypothetical protein